MKKEISVLIYNDQHDILIQKRSANKRSYPNRWALLHGHVEEGETVEVAAVRECKEELGIEVEMSELHPFTTIENSETHATYYFYVRFNKNEAEFILQKEELSQVKWCSINDVIDMIKKHGETIVYKEDKIELFQSFQKKLEQLK